MIGMKPVEEELNGLVFEYAALPSVDSPPLSLANFCGDLERSVEAVDAISRSIGDSDIDPRGQAAALAIVTTQLLFNVRVMRLLLLKQAGHR
jgi:hypothetical protein